MKKYVEFETKILKWVQRGLLTQCEAVTKVQGYLQAMVDFGILPEDRLSDELSITVKKIFSIKR